MPVIIILLVSVSIVSLITWIVACLCNRVFCRTANETLGEKKAESLPWWLPLSFLEFQMPQGVIVITGLIFALATIGGFAILSAAKSNPVDFILNMDFELFPAPFLFVLIAWIPDLIRETGRLFLRRTIILPKACTISRRTVIAIVACFFGTVVLLGLSEYLQWHFIETWERSRSFNGIRYVWMKRAPKALPMVALMLFQALLCSGIVWSSSRELLNIFIRDHSGTRFQPARAYFAVCAWRSVSIPTFFLLLLLFGADCLSEYNTQEAEALSSFGWMMGLHLWIATVPLMLMSRKVVPRWMGCLLLLSLFVSPLVFLFRPA